MKALLIDPETQTITPIEINSWRDIAPALKADLFDVVQINPKASIFVDDEGLYVPGQHFFYTPFYPQPLAGRGVVLGFDETTGDSIDCPLTADQLSPFIQWLGNAPLGL